MGNPSSKESSSNIEKYQLQWEEDYKKAVEQANISATTWEELHSKLAKHIENSAQIEKEWDYLQQKDTIVGRKEELYIEANKPYNKPKNRYLNILPFDNTRVKITANEIQGSDYINANWVTSAERVYICTQAPLESGINEFHRMLWETNTSMIVMLTKHVELGKIKAHDYLPAVNAGAKKFGEIDVEVTSDEPSSDQTYFVRKIKMTKGSETKNVVQFYFHAWPDHGVPDVSQPILDMMIHADSVVPPGSKDAPTVVHCSAGVGRTGTYVIINSILEAITQHMKKNPTNPPNVNMMKTLHDLREMRGGLVNHKDQYIFCYKTILAHIEHLIKNSKN